MNQTDLLERNPVLEEIIVTDDIANNALVIEDFRSELNDLAVNIMSKVSAKLSLVCSATGDALTSPTKDKITSILKNKEYTNIRHLNVPTLPGFTGSYSELISCLNKHVNSMFIDVNQIVPARLFFEKLLSSPDLFKTNSMKAILPPTWIGGDAIWKTVRNDLSSNFKQHDNKSNRVFGDCFANLAEYDKAVEDIKHLLTIISVSRIKLTATLVDSLDNTARKCLMQYITKPGFPVSNAVRSQAVEMLRTCALATETFAFYVHILTQASVSLTNIATHLKKIP